MQPVYRDVRNNITELTLLQNSRFSHEAKLKISLWVCGGFGWEGGAARTPTLPVTWPGLRKQAQQATAINKIKFLLNPGFHSFSLLAACRYQLIATDRSSTENRQSSSDSLAQPSAQAAACGKSCLPVPRNARRRGFQAQWVASTWTCCGDARSTTKASSPPWRWVNGALDTVAAQLRSRMNGTWHRSKARDEATARCAGGIAAPARHRENRGAGAAVQAPQDLAAAEQPH